MRTKKGADDTTTAPVAEITTETTNPAAAMAAVSAPPLTTATTPVTAGNGQASAESVDTLATARKRFPGMAPEAYRHPLDQQATDSLRSVPGFEYAVSKLSKFSIEHILYVTHCATAVKVTDRQCSRIYALLREACAILDVTEPALFLSQTPIANAFALGKERPMMVLHTGLVELLTEEELLGVIAHELGHIHCGHSIYRLMLLLIQLAGREGGRRLGVGDAFTLPVEMALLEWARKAEFSADRAAILVTQNAEAVFSTLFKLTGGSPKIFEQMDREEYLKQAEEYDRPDAGKLEKFYRTMLEAGMTHPIPVLRAREALRYGESDEYKAILEGRYTRYDKNRRLTPAASTAPTICPHCGQEADTSFSFCVHCGGDIRLIAASEAEPTATPKVEGSPAPVEETAQADAKPTDTAEATDRAAPGAAAAAAAESGEVVTKTEGETNGG